MTIHLLQVLASGFLLLFGILALRVLRRFGPAQRDRSTLAWSLAAAYFLVSGGYSAAHAFLAALGAVLGHTSALYRWVGSWAVAATLARGAVSIVFAGMLIAVVAMRRRGVLRMVHSAPWLLGAACVLATAAAFRIPMTDADYQYLVGASLAVMSTLTAILIMGALLVAVRNDGIDQLLWLALALYALKETLTVSQMAVLAWWTVAPHREVFYFFFAISAVLAGGMCAVAARRLHMAGAGQRVPALFERLYTQRRSPVS